MSSNRSQRAINERRAGNHYATQHIEEQAGATAELQPQLYPLKLEKIAQSYLKGQPVDVAGDESPILGGKGKKRKKFVKKRFQRNALSMNTKTEVQQASQHKITSNNAIVSDEEVNVLAYEYSMLEEAAMAVSRRKKTTQTDSSLHSPMLRPEKLQLVDHTFSP